MKRIMAILLVLVMALGLCACGSDRYKKYEHILAMLENGNYDGAISAIEQIKANPNAGQSNGNKPSGNPTDEELKLIMQYNSICSYLQGGEENMHYGVYVQETSDTLRDQEALRFCYETLEKLEAVDKWIGTVHAYQGGLSRQELMDKFTMVKDVPLWIERTGLDQMGNTFENQQGLWEYYENGLIRRYEDNHPIQHLNNSRYYEWIYDEDGKLVKKEYRSSDNKLESLITYFYDDQNRISKEVFKSNSGETEYLYSYDDKGNLARITWSEYDYIAYTYDDAGNLIREEKHRSYDDPSIMTYTYDAQGKLVSGVYKYYYYPGTVEDQYEYTCDDKGRVLSWKITFGDKKNQAGETVSKPETVYVVDTIVYGNYYFYDFSK